VRKLSEPYALPPGEQLTERIVFDVKLVRRSPPEHVAASPTGRLSIVIPLD